MLWNPFFFFLILWSKYLPPYFIECGGEGDIHRNERSVPGFSVEVTSSAGRSSPAVRRQWPYARTGLPKPITLTSATAFYAKWIFMRKPQIDLWKISVFLLIYMTRIVGINNGAAAGAEREIGREGGEIWSLLEEGFSFRIITEEKGPCGRSRKGPKNDLAKFSRSMRTPVPRCPERPFLISLLSLARNGILKC